MTKAHDWSWLEHAASAPAVMTLDDYIDLPETGSRRIEVVGGMIVFCESPSIHHSAVQRNLTSALFDQVEKHDADTDECHQVHADLDLIEKRARYAAAGIPWYWIVRMVGNDGKVASIERLRLSSDGHYVAADITHRSRSTHAVETTDPLPITISWDALDRGL